LQFSKVLAGAKNVLPIIDQVPDVKNEINSKELLIDKGEVSFENVNFSYDKNGPNILNSINLKIPGKQMTALVGPSGSGKSTILNLIPRFYNVNSGKIKIDNQNITKLHCILFEKIFL
jgi:ABC-type multidrug transport system fused ATPase/permease subunit